MVGMVSINQYFYIWSLTIWFTINIKVTCRYIKSHTKIGRNTGCYVGHYDILKLLRTFAYTCKRTGSITVTHNFDISRIRNGREEAISPCRNYYAATLTKCYSFAPFDWSRLVLKGFHSEAIKLNIIAEDGWWTMLCMKMVKKMYLCGWINFPLFLVSWKVEDFRKQHHLYKIKTSNCFRYYSTTL